MNAHDHTVPSSHAPFSPQTTIFPTQSVPFPAELLDRAMPHLTDTEWRLLCVVVRQTLGWQDKQTGGRKQKDWLTQTQLTARTGRTAKPVAQAISSLTAKQLIQVVSDDGEALLTPAQRRRYAGRHWFQLHPQWSNAWPIKETEQRYAATPLGARRKCGSEGETPHGVSPHEEGRQRELAVRQKQQTRRSTLLAEAQRVFTAEKVHTTKETDYKYKEHNHGKQVGFLYTVPNGSSQRMAAPARLTRGSQNDQGVSDHTDQHRGRAATYSSQAVLRRASWDQEAAGDHWRWHKDLAQWVSYEVDEKEEQGQQQGGRNDIARG